MTETRLKLITTGILMSLFLSSMEGTVVATAMPSIVGQLGGLSIYSWVFAVYMLTSTTSGPIYGKLSDLYGRKKFFIFSMLLFLAGSFLCAQAHSMEQLILFRAIQGLGAGGVLPLAFTMIGYLFTLEQRAKMQGIISGVWGVSAVIGPLIGGFLVDQVSWQWVFYINVIPGALAVGLVWYAMTESERRSDIKLAVDYRGAIFLILSALSLLLGLNELGTPLGWWCMAAAAGLFAMLMWVERRAIDPILPLQLFKGRLFSVSIIHGLMTGWAMFGSLNYIPLFVQAVLGTGATEAGISLTPMMVTWTLASIFGAPLLLKVDFRALAFLGMILMVGGTFLMSQIGMNTSLAWIMVYTALMGIGMGLSVPSFFIAVQSTVRKDAMGAATAMIQFSRNIGATIGVSVLGALLSARLTTHLLEGGINPATVSIDSLLDPVAGASIAMEGPLRQALALSIANIFIIAFAAAVAGLLSVFFAPRGRIAQLMEERVIEQIEPM